MKPAHELAYEDYKKGMKYQEIADKYSVSINTVKSWHKRHGWKKSDAPENKKVHTKRGAPFGNKNAEGSGAPPGNNNAAGNAGGGAPPGNHNAITHSMYAKYLPDETLQIAAEVTYKSPIDLLWESITIKYAAVIRAQKIMYVANAQDDTQILVSERMSIDKANGKQSGSRTFKVYTAAEKQAAFLLAQSRAMGTLNNMLKQYDELCRSELATEEQRLRVDKLRGELASKSDEDNQGNIDQLFDSLDKARQELGYD